ncbi:hypothetical protein ADUPG1_003164, partial [Aduncisulcus paluster]
SHRISFMGSIHQRDLSSIQDTLSEFIREHRRLLGYEYPQSLIPEDGTTFSHSPDPHEETPPARRPPAVGLACRTSASTLHQPLGSETDTASTRALTSASDRRTSASSLHQLHESGIDNASTRGPSSTSDHRTSTSSLHQL